MRIRLDFSQVQTGFQDPGSEMILGILDLHDRIMFYLIIILIVVLWFFISSQTERKKNYVNIAHGNLIEFLWTLIPAGILWGIGLPSLKLLYLIDSQLDSEITLSVKIIGQQWYWNYEFLDFSYEPLKATSRASYSSFMLDDQALTLGDKRLLSTDNSLILPVFSEIRFLITSSDVIHSFAIPSLGLKCDAIPGRLNSTSVCLTRESTYYGQCSELCGILHGFMPIEIRGVSLINYLKFIQTLHT